MATGEIAVTGVRARARPAWLDAEHLVLGSVALLVCFLVLYPLLILFFSLGLAGVLTAIGFAFVYADAISRRLPWLRRITDHASRTDGLTALAVRAVPSLAALAVLAAGVVITLRAVATLLPSPRSG